MTPTAGAIADLGEVNMGDPSTLASFVNWATTAFPATHNALILWDHGGGWQYGVCYDEASKDWLTMSDLNAALAQVPNLDVLAIDACLMGEVEVAYQLSNYCDYFVASADNIPFAGYDYTAILDPGVLTGRTESAAWSQSLVDAYHNSYNADNPPDDPGGYTLVAADMIGIGGVTESFRALATALTLNLATDRTAIQGAYDNSRHYDSGKAIDLYDFCDELSSNARFGGQPQRSCRLWTNSPSQTGTAWNDYNAGGLSVYFPTTSGALKSTRRSTSPRPPRAANGWTS